MHESEQPPNPIISKKTSESIGCFVFLILMLFGLFWISSTAYTHSQYGPLQRTADAGDLASLRDLLKSGVDPNSRCEFRTWTALHVAAETGHKEVAEVLIQHGAKVNLRDSDGWTPLAVTSGSEGKGGASKSSEAARNAVALVLLEHGADPNALTNFGDTPLHCAVRGRDTALICILLKHGADPTRKNSQGDTPAALCDVFMSAEQARQAKQCLANGCP